MIEEALQWDKDPNASLRYGFDVVDLLAPGDAVSGVTVADQAGVTASAPEYAGTEVFCRVAGGTVGEVATVTLRWTTVQGDTDDRTLRFTIVQM